MDKSQMESADMELDIPIDPAEDIRLDLHRTTTHYSRFNGRFLDENLEIEDIIPVLIPSKLETTNCLQFKLVLLQSDIVPQDYVVGWGIFPLLNSDFQLNEGKFKVPLLFGNVDPRVDKFDKIEMNMMKDLDNWVSNLYFEIEKVNLMDLKEDKKTKRLYYHPVSGMTAQEQQQVNKQEQNDDYEDEIEVEKEKKDFLLQGLDDNGGYLMGGQKNVKDDEPDPFLDRADDKSQSQIQEEKKEGDGDDDETSSEEEMIDTSE